MLEGNWWRTSDTFHLYLLKKKQENIKEKYVILCWNGCIKKHVILKHFILVMNNIYICLTTSTKTKIQTNILYQNSMQKINFKLDLRRLKYANI
jgi:hypothetical protein